MSKFAMFLFVTCLFAGLLCARGYAQEKKTDAKADKKPKPKFTIGKDTTYINGPVDKDGYIDYAAALNDRLRRGVTPENNANVLIWKALGPRPEGKRMSPEYYRLLGVDPPDEGDYFVDLRSYAKNQLKLDALEIDDIEKQLNRAGQRPWTEKDYPHVADWLKANEKPLALFIEATQRTQYYSPLVPQQNDKGSAGLLTALLPSVQKCRIVAKALSARAMLRLGRGDVDGSWNDLLACHRLGRLVGKGGCLIEALVGFGINGAACQANAAFLDSTKLTAKQIEKCQNDLRDLLPLPLIADKVDVFDRFLMLEMLMMVSRHGTSYLNSMADGPPGKTDPLVDAFIAGADWDPALRNANKWYDRFAAALREKDHATRENAISKYITDIKALKSTAGNFGSVIADIGDGKDLNNAFAAKIGDIMISLMAPAANKVQESADRANQRHDNLLIAFALARHHRDLGRYPKDLSELAPKYLKQVPKDLFSGKPLNYRPNEKGYLLYSVGVNGKADDGRDHDDEPRGDDLNVRIPLPELRK